MRLANLVVLVLLGAIWGASFLFIKLGLESFPPATLVALRLAGGALVLVLAMLAQGHRFPAARRAWGDMLLVGVVGMVVPFVLISWGEQHISSGLAAILVATTPLFTLLLAFVWTRDEHLGLLRSLGVLLGFVGVALAVQVQQLSLFSSSAYGLLAVLGAALCYGFAAIYGRRAFHGLPPIVPAAGTMSGGLLCIVPVALLVDGLPAAWPTGSALVGVLGLAFLSTACAYILYYWILGRIGSSRTTMVTYLVPIFALVFGWLWLDEHITVYTIAGLLLVLAGIMIANGALSWRRQAAAVPRP